MTALAVDWIGSIGARRRLGHGGNAAGQSLGDLELALDLSQEHHAGIRGQPTTIEGNVNRLAGDG